jgi:predicted nucleic acid-binding protein
MYLLDTNTVIYFCNSKLPEGARNLLFGIDPAIPVISHIELFANSNLPEKEKATLEAFVASSRVYDHIDLGIVSGTIAIRQQYKTKLPDAIIAATALANNLTLITHNISDFRKIKGLRLLDPLDTGIMP